MSQACLGWDQLYHGRLTTQWAITIDDMHPNTPATGQQILVYMIQAVWQYILATWRLRNQHLHQDNGLLNLPDYQQAVTNFYERGQQLPPETQAALFRCPLQDMLTLPPAALQAWLEWSSLYIKQQMKAVKTRALKTPDICSFSVTQSMNDLQPQ